MLTTLPKHRGRNGPILAFCVLVATTIVILWTQPTRQRTTPEAASRAIPAVPAPPSLPATSISIPPPSSVVTPPSGITGTGIIGYDETKTSHLAAPVAGWLKKTRAKWLSRPIRAGETLAVVYSPEVYLTSVEVLKLRQDYRSRDALDAAQTHLLQIGMPPWTLTKMQQSGVPERSVPLIARVSGTVVLDQVEKDQLVDAWSGIELFTITDPTRYWLYIDVPAADAAKVKLGTQARVTIEGMKTPATGKVGYVFRRVEGGMRSLRIDLQSRTPLRVGAGATAEIKL